ncbi:phosphotransferase family protein [Mesorhizobium sp. CO1-1-8]|uniref:phosphotransferase family protein n=1 Tax=Mesorhizobium sp. CO1-1-8 TaxID=2876631 RepID=UPI001CD141C1|nr:phosphotransferase family protein [Mesorhizobium sp. CO1-1-8]MBZ9772228.1 phosphotransferase family protein [Mesorhizobium sp. CO1-1-8]
MSIVRLRGGQSNPTFLVESGAGRLVLRSRPRGLLLPSAHAVHREFLAQSALAGTSVPVPTMLAYCHDPTVFGSEFYVMDFVAGRTFVDPLLNELSRTERTSIFHSMNTTIAAIHSVDVDAIGLGEFGRREGYITRQIARWSKQYERSKTSDNSAWERLVAWLLEHAPADSASRLVHGDFRLDNVLVHPVKPEVVSVIDWELSTLGDPIADFAYHVMIWRLSPTLFRGLAGVQLEQQGVPDEARYVADYFEKTRFESPAKWEYYLVLAMFRLAAILQGIAKRWVDGTASDPEAAELGAKSLPVSELAWSIARGL